MPYKAPEGYYTVSQVAKIVGVTVSAIEWNRQMGRLRVEKTPTGRLLISEEALAAFLAARDPEAYSEQRHLYEIICITCGKVDVLFQTHSLTDLCLKYTHMLEHNHKLVRIRLDGVPLLIHESDRIGYTYHPRTRGGKGVGKKLERSEGRANGDLPGHVEGRVQHGEESAILRRGAHGTGEADLLGSGAQAGEPEKPVPAVPSGEQGTVQGGPWAPGREEHSGISARPGRKRRLTDEERKLRARERYRRWRQNNLEKVREADRNRYQANREERIERNKKWAREHREKMREYQRKHYQRKREAENGTGEKGD